MNNNNAAITHIFIRSVLKINQPIADCQWPTANCRSPIAFHQLPTDVCLLLQLLGVPTAKAQRDFDPSQTAVSTAPSPLQLLGVPTAKAQRDFADYQLLSGTWNAECGVRNVECAMRNAG